MAKAEATEEPDLVVHLGDYLYRESACPPGNTSCAGSPSGYGWDSWNADFFEAARPLLRKAPWIFVRGNHELCSRAGEGWFRFLDPYPLNGCKDATDPYQVKLQNSDFVVLDSALATDLTIDPDQVKIYEPQFKAIEAMKLHHAWLLTHKPLWVPVLTKLADPQSAMTSFNQTMQAASKNHLPSEIKTVFSGHVHLFQELHFADGRPSQIVAGNGGTALNTPLYPNPAGVKIAGTTVTSGSVMPDFGYFTLKAERNGTWSGIAHDSTRNPRLYCNEIADGFRCEAPQEQR